MDDPVSKKVTLKINSQSYPCEADSSLLNAIIAHELLIETACGGKGTCHLCRVSVIHHAPDSLNPPTRIEHRALGNVLLNEGVRLSCQVTVSEGLEVELPKYETKAERRRRRSKSKKKKM